ncbi:hypothetical protein QSE00_23655 [Arenibacter sp. M-2]|uniref:hypothetical protein n=1 Tax=Arenibacter sp. M-2 TaxID=3053612 RepID=UPI0025708564|nr:hypothetical protein [Arenibacter sp. M-2]MDL5514826.1 hypothetical protein [Arenibacter sp. M-2]
MKALLLIFLIIYAITACETKDEVVVNIKDNFYELQYIDAGLSGQIIEKEDLDFNEYIEFFPDSTFVKQRIYMDSTSIAKGNYNYLVNDEYMYLKLTYEIDTYLIQSCGRILHEYMKILGENEIFNGSYLPCDGPGYYYQRIKK